MLESFINRHKIATVITLFCAVALVVIILISSLIISVTPKDTGTDGPGESTTLPYSNDLYTISAISDNTITIDAPEQFRNAAIQQLYKMGVEPTDYKIKFTYESPFKAYE